MKKIFKTTLIASTIALLAACGDSSKETTSTEVKESNEVASVEKQENKITQKQTVASNITSFGLEIKEGEHYKKLPSPIELEGLSDYSLLEIFWLGCPHCQRFESGVRDWKKVKPESLQLKKMHAVSGNPRWVVDAHIYNSFEMLGASDAVMDGLFDIYIEQMKAYKIAKEKDANTEEKPFPSFEFITEYVKASNLDVDKFAELFQGEEIKKIVSNSREVFDKAQLSGVPAFIVNKEYMLTGKDLKNYTEYFEVAEKVAELTKK